MVGLIPDDAAEEDPEVNEDAKKLSPETNPCSQDYANVTPSFTHCIGWSLLIYSWCEAVVLVAVVLMPWSWWPARWPWCPWCRGPGGLALPQSW